jgi:hypothetical protein
MIGEHTETTHHYGTKVGQQGTMHCQGRLLQCTAMTWQVIGNDLKANSMAQRAQQGPVAA